MRFCPAPPSPCGKFAKAAVVSNGGPSAQIGVDILKRNGSAVEAAIATSLCDCVTRIMSMGIGGGFVMTVYEKKTKTAMSLVARETAPLASTQDMFHGNSEESSFGARAAAVPGELKGYQAAYERYKSGNIPWKDLFEPTIKLCEEGINLTEFVVHNMAKHEKKLRTSKELCDVLMRKDGTIPLVDEIYKLPVLAKTLRIVADSPKMADELYNGSLTKAFVEDIQRAGGIITEEDMMMYKTDWVNPVVVKIKDGLTLHSVPPPSSGAVLAFMMQLLRMLVPAEDGKKETDSYRIIETFKHAYGIRSHMSSLSPEVVEYQKRMLSPEHIEKVRTSITEKSPPFTSEDYHYYGGEFILKPDHGTGNIAVLAPNGDAVSLTSSINNIFGSFFVSNSTGILLNNHMDDFSSINIINSFGLPPSPANFIEPGKRPMSSMCPSVFTDENGEARLIIGSAGGTQITTSVAFVSMLNLLMKKNLNEAMDEPRIHHQLMPMALKHEQPVDTKILKKMEEYGHKLKLVDYDKTSCVTAISQQQGEILAVSDFRWDGGAVAGF